MKYASYGLMGVGVLLAAYGGYCMWFTRDGDWLELGIGAVGMIAAVAGVVLGRVSSQTAS